jgi:formiminotetrahydrofolate cyclodeaminase
MNKIAHYKIEKFLSNLAASSPTPGGGATAALAGAMAASLVTMVAGLTFGKEKYKKVAGKMRKISQESRTLKTKFMVLADQDVAAFNRVMLAYKSKNQAQIIKALKKATSVPEQVILLAKRVQKLAREVANHGNKNAYSDAKSAFFLGVAAEKSALENVRINRKALASLE